MLGLRVDACTYLGAREGLPRILDLLARLGLRASFFCAMGPDRSGLAALRVFRVPGFLAKMLRTRAPSMYGWRTLLHGTLLPAPRIAERTGEVLRRAAAEGHEVGIHSWDHVRWQDRLDRLDARAVREDYERAIEAFEAAAGTRPRAAAAPAWLASSSSLLAAEELGLEHSSDVRGRCPFLPVIGGRALTVPQVPVTLPTLDELLGRGGLTAEGFRRQVLRSLELGRPNVLAVHAEAEGRAHLGTLEALLLEALAAGWEVVPLGEVLARVPRPLPRCPVERGTVPGRAGEVSLQGREVGEASADEA
ncbi:MAG: 4-deoxy-4-formamido-L-arabinose-phosphoundecaprenol deformylase [Planctomycetes bacterium]|nr:4-deoxy-4-formamido-L-arabinose-phosphoundecaprenol deformylase [Planctomycetota bacterium]